MSDTTPIILAVIGTGVTLLGVLAGLLVFLFRTLRLDMAGLRQDIKETNARMDSMGGTLNSRIDSMGGSLNSRIDSLRQEMRTDIAALHSRIDLLRQEMRTDIAALHSRIDALYQALFNHKDSAA